MPEHSSNTNLDSLQLVHNLLGYIISSHAKHPLSEDQYNAIISVQRKSADLLSTNRLKTPTKTRLSILILDRTLELFDSINAISHLDTVLCTDTTHLTEDYMNGFNVVFMSRCFHKEFCEIDSNVEYVKGFFIGENNELNRTNHSSRDPFTFQHMNGDIDLFIKSIIDGDVLGAKLLFEYSMKNAKSIY